MAALLSKLKEHKRTQGPTPYLDTVLAAFPRDTMAPKPRPERSRQCTTPQTLQDTLSERELEVLQLIAHGASNQEI
ncbi:MAG: LuxR C-terminal-related transcriptional regulator, partial [Ktedonobacteraceae bacterium]